MTDSDTMAEIQANIESIERTWERYGLPAVIAAWFALGLLAGLGLCVVMHA